MSEEDATTNEVAKPTANADLDQLPTIKQALEQWLGMQLPGLPPIPKTLKNLDKACAAMLDTPAAYFEAKAQSQRGVKSRQGKIDDALAEKVIEELSLGQLPEMKAAVTGMLREHMQKQHGRKRVLELAARELENRDLGKDATSSIDDDWMTFFKARVDELSSDESRLIFAKIIAGEVKEPGAFSRSSMTVLAEMNQKVGRLFDLVCGIATVVYPGPDGHIILATFGMQNANQNSLLPYGLSFSALNLLDEAGLIMPAYSGRTDMSVFALGRPFSIGNSTYMLAPQQGKFKSKEEQTEPLKNIPGTVMTAVGRELMTIVSKTDNDAYIRALTENYAKVGFNLRKLPAN